MWTPHGFWVSFTDNRVFDGFVTRHVAANTNIVALNGFYKSDAYSFSNIVKRLHAARRGIRVLFYTWAGRKLLGGKQIGAVPTLAKMEFLTDRLLKDSTTHEPIVETDAGASFIFLDPRVDNARTWFRDRVRKVAESVRSDGVALDSAIRSPAVLSRVESFEYYPPAFDLMIEGVSAAVPIAIFNGLTRRPEQQALLAYADGASIEFFGLNDTLAATPTFADDIRRYLDAMASHSDKTFLVFGRASRRPEDYSTYEEDWRWQRYLYCSYLLAAGPNTRWKQLAGFLVSPPGGRAGGLDLYSDARHDLGPALGDYTIENGVYRRAFKNGLILVVPAESGRSRGVQVGQMFTPEGARVSGRIVVAPGEGHLLLKRRPVPPPALLRRFEPASDPLWRWSAFQQDSNRWYLHLENTPEDDEFEHDLALDLVRFRAPRWHLTLWYRTSDASARVQTVVEVDDDSQQARFALVDGAVAVGAGKGRQPAHAQFRSAAPSASQFFLLRVVGGGATMIADGQWRTLVLNLDAACAATPGYTFRRAVFVRLLGSMDLRRVRLASQPGKSAR
jgi:Hypothetical glycosyl hydrolase family 15